MNAAASARQTAPTRPPLRRAGPGRRSSSRRRRTSSCFFGSITVRRRPRRWIWMRSATSNTCGILCEIRMIGRPRFFTSRISSSTRRDSLTPSAAVGSSMMTTRARERRRARHRDALALAARKRLDRLIDVLDRHQPEFVELLAREFLHRAAIERAKQRAERRLRRDFASEEHVVGDRQRRRQREVLIDGFDARLARVDRRAEVNDLARRAGFRRSPGSRRRRAP